MTNKRKWVVAITFLCILLFGATLRLTGVNWDENQHLHPDERFLTMVVEKLRFPDSVGGYFDSNSSTLNPHNHDFSLFVYGIFPLILTRHVCELIGMTEMDEIHIVGRILSSLFDLLSIALVFLLGRRLFGVRYGLLGAFFTSASVLCIQQSHFFTVDAFATPPILLSFWFALDICERRGMLAFILAGAFLGLAIAIRVNLAPFAVILLISWLFNRRVWGAALMLVATVTIFRLFQPYAFNGPGFFSPRIPKLLEGQDLIWSAAEVMSSWAGGINIHFMQNMIEVKNLVTGRLDLPSIRQWVDRTAYVFPFESMVFWGFGLALGLAAWAGFFVAIFESIKKRRYEPLLIVIWVALTFAITGQQFAKVNRYFLQIYPFLALLAAYLVLRLWDNTQEKTFARIGAGMLIAIVIGHTLFWSVAFTSIYTRPHSRISASRWIYDHVTANSAISSEYWDDELPLRIDDKDSRGEMYRPVKMYWYDEDTLEKRDRAIQWINDTDYIVLSSNRLSGSIMRLPQRYPMATKYYESLFNGELGFEKVAEFTSRPRLFGIEVNDDDAEETFTVYDHPKVLIFKKTQRYSQANTEQILGSAVLACDS